MNHRAAKKIIALADLAIELGVTTDTLLRWHKAGIVELFKIGKLWFCAVEERDRLISDARSAARVKRPTFSAAQAAA